jgi:eukaryotic-like serine/threonine-protein kinase
MLRRRTAFALLVPAAFAASAGAQEWHESYRDGVKALSQGQPARAIVLLEAAVAQRPQPGRNVITYGTNVVDRYYPYLHLAEAHLALRDVAGARAALRRSENFAREPAEDRRRLAAQADELAARLAPPVVVIASIAPPPPVTARPAPVEAAPPIATTLAAAPSVTAAPLPAAPERSASARPVPPPPSLPSPRPAPVAAPDPSTLEVFSQPPGASVYLDDELVGTTDAEWGRLVRSGVPPGRHRVRLALAGHRDLVEDLDLVAGGRTELRRRLTPAAAAADQRLILSGAVAAVLLALTAWALRRGADPRPPPTPARPAFDPAAATPARGTPPGGMGNPGVRRDADGSEHFGEYRLMGPLGRGGMASVYKAERRGEICAIKRPLPAFLEEPEFLERFLREAEIGRTLNHPNIVRILERGEVEGVPFFTMELVPGETLQARLQRDGAMDPRAAALTIVQVAEALDYAHLKGVVHRDLKPSNVMILPDGTAKVMDYGIARARRFEGLTVTGSFLGSPEYVAPEAIEGGDTDARSDLYSLGVVFHETLAGRRPFVAETAFAVLRMHLTQPPPPLVTLRPEVPPALEQIVLRLLAKEPDRRYASAEELVLELRDFLYRAA